MLPGARQVEKRREMGCSREKPSRWDTPILANWGYVDPGSSVAKWFEISKRTKIPKLRRAIQCFLNTVLKVAWG